MTTTLCVSGAVLARAGADVSPVTALYIDDWINEAESEINSICKYNFNDQYASLNVDVKYLLRAAASTLAAIRAVCYDMSLYESRTVAEDIINVLRDDYLRMIGILKNKDIQGWVKGAATNV